MANVLSSDEDEAMGETALAESGYLDINPEEEPLDDAVAGEEDDDGSGFEWDSDE